MRTPDAPTRPPRGAVRAPLGRHRRLGDLLLLAGVLMLLPAGATALLGGAPVWALAAAVAGQTALYAAQQLLLRARLSKALPSTWVAGVASTLALASLLVAWAGGALAAAPGVGDVQSRLALVLLSSSALVAGSALATVRLCGVRADPRLAWTAAGTCGLLVAQVLAVLRAAGVLAVPVAVVVAVVVVSLGCAAGVLAAPSRGGSALRRAAVGYDATGAVAALAMAVATLVVGNLREVPLSAVALALGALTALVASGSLLAREVLALQGAHLDAHTDELTGAANRRGFRRALLAALGSDPRSDVALVLVDLDRFKQVNDDLGHLAGDDLLRVVADRLRAAVRAGDLVARIGGDEFAVLVRGADAARVARTAERVHDCFTGPVQLEGRSLRVSGSTGVAVAPAGAGGGAGTLAEDLFRRADAAMYAAKAAGTGPVVDPPAPAQDAPRARRTPAAAVQEASGPRAG